MGKIPARSPDAGTGSAPAAAPDNAADDAAAGPYYDVAVIGGGVVGHGIAWAARCSGRSVAIIDDAPGSGASWAAAGMLAPVSELHYQEEALLEIMLESSRLWPGFAAGLERVCTPGTDASGSIGATTGYLTTPTLAVGADAADRRALADLRSVQQSYGLA
ncbi:MAG TPA: FAD-dependent oxidoreductase, partial [Arthrobacter sp.]|nr:FAD-dependent oxidoreductase [Arthrobacter sp.]